MKKKQALYYGLVGFLVATAVLFVEIWAINWRFLLDVIFSNSRTFVQKLELLGTTGESFEASFPLASQVSIVILALLAGIYVGLLLYYLRHHYQINKAAGLGVMGSVFGTLGIGCGACGSVVLSTVLGVSATAALLSFLPLRGVEFSVVGIVVLATAIFLLVRQLQTPAACRR